MVRCQTGLQRTPPEQSVGSCAVLLRDAISNLMTHGQVHLISNPQSQAQGCQRVGLGDSNLAILESPGQGKFCTPLRDLEKGEGRTTSEGVTELWAKSWGATASVVSNLGSPLVHSQHPGASLTLFSLPTSSISLTLGKSQFLSPSQNLSPPGCSCQSQVPRIPGPLQWGYSPNAPRR